MADTEKDRFGEKIREKEKGQEDAYFARRDRELIEKQREERRKLATAAGGAMNCPRCGTGLTPRVVHDITIDECPTCGGLWLDKGEMEHIARREEEGWLGHLLRARLAKK